MTGSHTHYISQKLEARQKHEKGVFGVFANQQICRGELLAMWGGRIVSRQVLDDLPPLTQRYAVQVEEGLYMVPTGPAEPADYFNHCCSPNAGMSGQIGVVAMREIEPGEEVCIDYAMCDGSSYDEFLCACGTPRCRSRVTGEDWRLPELWERYAGFFSPYLQRRIDRLKKEE